MKAHDYAGLTSAVFITFSGNCKNALTFYQTCFGGILQFDTLINELPGYSQAPVVCGSLVSDRIILHGSDLVHSEGRKLGNYLAIYLPCTTKEDRCGLIQKLEAGKSDFGKRKDAGQKLIEITDMFDVRWVLSVSV